MSRGPKCTSLFQRLVRPWTESRAASEAVAERAGFASLAGCSGSSAPLSRVQDAVRIFNSGGISRPVISDLLSRRFWGEAARSFSQGTALGKGEAFAKGTTRLLESPLTAGMPDNGRKWVTWWLGGATGWVFALVVLGGVTRLTRSGLSMTDWKFSGEKPPMNQVGREPAPRSTQDGASTTLFQPGPQPSTKSDRPLLSLVFRQWRCSRLRQWLPLGVLCACD